jgi:transposase-like protein
VLDEVRDWQSRPLDAVYPVVFFDALRVKIRDESVVKNKAVYLALALDCEGHKHVLGLWIEQSEGAKFWLRVMNELKNRGVDDLLFAVVDGLKGFPDAITAVFPRAIVQTCIVHLIRHSLSFVSWQDRKRLMPALRAVYRAEIAEHRLGDFEAEWGKKYPAIGLAWRRAWNEVTPFFAYPQQIRKMIYTTDEIDKRFCVRRDRSLMAKGGGDGWKRCRRLRMRSTSAFAFAGTGHSWRRAAVTAGSAAGAYSWRRAAVTAGSAAGAYSCCLVGFRRSRSPMLGALVFHRATKRA